MEETFTHSINSKAAEYHDLPGDFAGATVIVGEFYRIHPHPKTVWLTGLSGSGKSTLAGWVENKLREQKKLAFNLDGDNIRTGLNSDLGFSPRDRRENIRRVAEVAKLFNQSGVTVLVSFISPYFLDRAMAREIIGQNHFLEIYLSTPLATCEQRDPKGLYRKARLGQIPEFTGISAPYEVPANPDLEINTEALSTEACGHQILAVIGK